MKEGQGKIWFPAKKYGIGWGFPVAWQGWIVLLAYVLLLIIGGKILTGPPHRISLFVVYVLALTGLLGLVCWKKGERIGFRRGKK